MPLPLEPSAEDKAYEQEAVKTESAPVVEKAKEPAPKPEAEEPRVVIEEEEKPKGRDEKGRFAGKEKGPEAAPAEAKKAEPEKPKELPRVAAPKMVKLGALQDERAKRQASEEAAAQYQRELKALRDEVERIKNPPKAAPDPNLDPDGYTNWKIAQLEQKVATSEKETADQKKAREDREATEVRIKTAAEYELASMEEFSRARPEQSKQYQAAHTFYKEKMRSILPGLGIRDPRQIEFTIDGMLLKAVEDARESGENAAERIWDLAGNMGFRPESEKQAAKPAEPEPTVDVENEDAVKTALKGVESKLEVLAAGQKASKTLSGGSSKQGGLTLTELLASAQGASLLEETDLDKVPMRKMKGLMGG